MKKIPYWGSTDIWWLAPGICAPLVISILWFLTLTILIHSGSTPTVEVSSFIIPLKVKQSLYRSGQALRVAGGWGSQISRQSAHEGCKGCQPYAPAAFTLRKYSWYSFLLEAESTSGPMTPSGIEPATYRRTTAYPLLFLYRILLHSAN